jgi:hypothetical protein
MAYSAIIKPSDYFFTKLWTGNNTAQTITGIPFAPDFVWIKNRSAAESHTLVNTSVGANNFLKSNATSANNTNTEFVKSFTSDGYTLGSADEVNNGSNNIVGWNWKANGAGATNEDGSINTIKTSASTASGFSVGTWTGNGSASTIGHGLGVAPAVVMVKNTSEVYGWQVYHQAIGATKYIALNDVDSEQTSSQSWNNTAPTSTVFTVGASDSNNKNGNVILFYAFSEIQGYSKFSSFKGNGNADGTFVYTGFKPAFIMAKKTSGAGDNWFIFDSKRAGYNVDNNYLHPDTNGAEGTSDYLDIVSNGFKLRTTGGDLNGSGATYIYMAFAETPFVANSGESIPTTAR